MHLSQSHHSDTEPIEVRYYNAQKSDYAVQVFLGSSYATLYMSVEEARQFVSDILAVLPAPVSA